MYFIGSFSLLVVVVVVVVNYHVFRLLTTISIIPILYAIIMTYSCHYQYILADPPACGKSCIIWWSIGGIAVLFLFCMLILVSIFVRRYIKRQMRRYRARQAMLGAEVRCVYQCVCLCIFVCIHVRIHLCVVMYLCAYPCVRLVFMYPCKKVCMLGMYLSLCMFEDRCKNNFTSVINVKPLHMYATQR